MATLTATPDPATGTVLVQIEQTVARDQFTRVVANGWGSPTFGPSYTVQSGALAQYSVNGTLGLIDVNVTGSDFMITLNHGTVDSDIQMLMETNTTPTGAVTRYGVVTRFEDISNYFRVVAVPALVTGLITLEIGVRVAGVLTVLTTAVTSLTVATNNSIRVQNCGNSIKVKLWNAATAEPEGWNLETTYPALLTGTRSGALARREAGNLTPTQFQYENSTWTYSDGVPSGENLRLFRVTPDGTRTEVVGSPFSTNPASSGANIATATFWDPGAPFDTDIFYIITSSCSDTALLTSNTVQLESDGFGWLRDPTDPTRNLAISMEDFYDECVDQDVIVFSGLGNPEYSNASGQFDIINAQRPRTVSQTRKNYASSVTLTSYSLDDILSLEDIFAPGSVLALSLPTGYGWAMRSFGTDYITIGDIENSFIGVDQRVTARVWSIPFRLSGPPVDTSSGGTGGNGVGGGGATYDELADSVLGTTYTTLTASGQTFDQVAAGVGY